MVFGEKVSMIYVRKVLGVHLDCLVCKKLIMESPKSKRGRVEL